jgi:hypothetical protein
MATCKEPAEMSRSVRIIHGSTAAALQASRIATKVETCINDAPRFVYSCIWMGRECCARVFGCRCHWESTCRGTAGASGELGCDWVEWEVLFSHERYDDTYNSIAYPQLRDLQLCTRPRRAMHIGWRQIVRQPEHPVSFNARCVALPSMFRPVVP